MVISKEADAYSAEVFTAHSNLHLSHSYQIKYATSNQPKCVITAFIFQHVQTIN